MAKGTRTYPDPDAESYFAVGQEFFRGAETLTRLANGVVTNTAYFLIGFALELILKSYIVHAGVRQVRDPSLHIHDLRKLWKWAATGQESPCTIPTPDWVEPVTAFHANLLGRYRPHSVNAFATPGPIAREEMAKLVKRVRELVVSS